MSDMQQVGVNILEIVGALLSLTLFVFWIVIGHAWLEGLEPYTGQKVFVVLFPIIVIFIGISLIVFG